MRLTKKSARIIAVSMCIAVAVTCTGCKSEEVKQTETAIKNIGEVTLESHKGLDDAESAYNSLGSDQRKVENAEELKAAQDAFDSLVENAVEDVESRINSIPDEVTLEDADDISNAYDIYTRAVGEVRGKVSNADKLMEAKAAVENLLIQNAIDAIDSIGTVTLSSESDITAAQDAYQAVPSQIRDKVTNSDALSDATSALRQLKQENAAQQKKAALAKLKVEKDEVEGITWYKPSCYPKYSNTRCYVLPYIGEKDGQYWLRCKVDYANSNWVFFTSIIINVDGVKRDTIEFSYADVTRDTAIGANLYEAADFHPAGTRLTLLSDIADSQKTLIRFEGSDYYYDFEVSAKDKQGIKDVLTAWDYLNS